MTHEEARELIPAFAASKLHGPALEGLRAHLSACGDCAELAAGIGDMVSTILDGGPDLLDPHPDEKALRAYFEGSRLPEAERVEKHLRVCASCRLEVSTMVHALDSGAGKWRSWARRASPSAQLGVAAGVLFVGLLIGMVLAALWRPQTGAIAQDGARPLSWSGPVDLHVLPAPTRGEAITRFNLKKGQPATVLHLPPVIPSTGDPDEKFRLLVKSEDGAVKFDKTFARSEMERAFEAWGVMPIFLPTSSLPSGRYEVIVLRDTAPSDKIASIPFEIVHGQ